MNRYTVKTYPTAQVPAEDAKAIAELLRRTWPPESPHPRRKARDEMLASTNAPAPKPIDSQSHIVYEGDRVVAHAETSGRDTTSDAGPMRVLMLGAVVVAPEKRGEGLGAQVVREAFKRVDRGEYPFCLFQTSFKVRPFYERLGCRVIDTPIINSTCADPPNGCFWDDVILIYPGEKPGWPDGPIDLQGPGW